MYGIFTYIYHQNQIKLMLVIFAMHSPYLFSFLPDADGESRLTAAKWLRESYQIHHCCDATDKSKAWCDGVMVTVSVVKDESWLDTVTGVNGEMVKRKPMVHKVLISCKVACLPFFEGWSCVDVWDTELV